MNTKTTVPEVLPLLVAYLLKPGNEVGGSLHIITDDGNDEPGHAAWCLSYARNIGDTDAIPILELMVQMSRTQIRKLCALADKQRYPLKAAR
jgi:hypothetical protein